MTTTTALEYGRAFEVTDVKASDSGWEVAGFASTYSIDLGGDQVVPGAFAESIRAWENGTKRVRFLYSHDTTQILGVPTELREDRRGLFGRFRISKTKLGEDVHTLLKDGAVDSFSIGYVPVDTEFAGNVRLLKQLDLIEVSLVAVPMQPEAVVTGVKHGARQDDLHAQLRHRLLQSGRGWLVPQTEAEMLSHQVGMLKRRKRLREQFGIYVGGR